VQKIINEVLAANPGGPPESQGQNMTFAKDARDLLIECCVEFIQMLSSEANDIAEKEAKKTIACEHITKALKELGFPDYVDELERVAESFRTSQVVSTRLNHSFAGMEGWE
jgi:histone H3/H4